MAAFRKITRALHHHPNSEEAREPYLIVGLGNPGAKYAKNRHNVGFQCLDHIASAHGIEFQRKRFNASLAEGTIDGHRVVLAKPLTFMNDSGSAVSRVRNWYKIPFERILVIYDDLDLPVGRVRIRPQGSSGGQRGVKSVIEQLGTQDWARIRVGIGRPTYGDPVDYVLGNFDRDQEPVILRVYDVVHDIVRCYLAEGVIEAMNAFNGKQIDGA